MIPLHKFLQNGGEIATNEIDVAELVAGLKNAGGSIYVDEEYVTEKITSTLFVTLHQDDPLNTLDYIMRNLKADEMSIERYADTSYVRLWWD